MRVLFWPHVCEGRKGPGKAGCFVFLVRCSAAHAPSHVWSQVCTFMHPPAAACQRISPVLLHALWNHGENLRESFVMPLFVRSTVWSSVHVLNMRCPAAAAAHKSWPSWLCSRNPSPPPRCEAALRRWENQVKSCLNLKKFVGRFQQIDGLPTNRPYLLAPTNFVESWFTFAGTKIFQFVFFPQLDQPKVKCARSNAAGQADDFCFFKNPLFCWANNEANKVHEWKWQGEQWQRGCWLLCGAVFVD